MSIHLSSDDVSTGSIYDGSINYQETLTGSFKVNYQYISSTAIPWIWYECRMLRVTVNYGEGENFTNIPLDYESLQFEDDTSIIAASIQTSINAELNLFSEGYYRDCTVVYVPVTNGSSYYTITFDDEVTINFDHDDCTARYVFNKFESWTGTEINIYDTFFTTSPKFLEMYIEESITEYTTSRNTYPTLLLSTGDAPTINQSVEFFNNTNTITFQIYRTNIPLSPCPIKNSWHLVLG